MPKLMLVLRQQFKSRLRHRHVVLLPFVKKCNSNRVELLKGIVLGNRNVVLDLCALLRKPKDFLIIATLLNSNTSIVFSNDRPSKQLKIHEYVKQTRWIGGTGKLVRTAGRDRTRNFKGFWMQLKQNLIELAQSTSV